jgi:WD40 repeat protein
LSADGESYSLIIRLYVVTSEQESVDLNRMYHVTDAGYLCGNRQGCMKGTRRGVLLQLEHWLTDEQDKRVFWLNGLAGTGKSTIAQTFAEMSFADGKLGASFFCSRDFENRSNLRTIFPTLAFQLAHRYPDFRQKLLPVLRANCDVGKESLTSQLEKLLVGPLWETQTQTLIIIDALDECRDEEPASALLSVLSRSVDKIPLIKFFITGRPEPRIRSGFRLELLRPHTDVLRLHDVEPDLVNSDIKLFLKTQLTNIIKNQSNCNFTADWPSPQDIDVLCKKAAGFFIYASTVIKFVGSQHHPPNERLALITSLPHDTSHEGKAGIDLLYTQVLVQAFCDVDQDFYSHLKLVVGAVILILHPLSINALSDLLRNCGTPSRIYYALRPLHSLLLIPDGTDGQVRIFHKSFPDFLLDSGRCTDHQFLIDPSIYHREILLSCFSIMKERLKRNICNLDDHTTLNSIKDLPACRESHIGGALEYACQFWTKHLLGTPTSGSHVEEVQQAIDKFFTTCLPYWIEVLALMENLGVGVYALNDVEQWCASVSSAQIVTKTFIHTLFIQAGILCKWTKDSQYLLLENFDAIHNSPSYLYRCGLPLSPSSSWLHKSYDAELSQGVKVVRGLPVEWGACSRTVPLPSYPEALACWNNTIAVGLKSNDIILLNGITGSQMGVLSGHTGGVRSLTFLLEGASIVSGSDDRSLKLWDVQTGGVIRTFCGHTDWVVSVSISPSHTTIASGSWDKTICLWDIQTGECHCILELQKPVYCVTFSPMDSQHLVSVSGSFIQHWDIDSCQIKSTYEGSSPAFSLDGTYFIPSGGNSATVQDVGSGVTVATCSVPNSYLRCCCFSPDGKLVAAVAGTTAYVWDITSSDPHLIETLIVQTYGIHSLTFFSSSSLISISYGNSVKFWQIGASSTDPSASDPKPTPPALAPIRSITLQAKDGIAISSDSDGVVRTWDLSTGHCKASFQTPVKGSHQRCIQLVDSRLILVWCADKKVYIQDAEKGQLLQTVDGPEKGVLDIRISGDGSFFFCLDSYYVQAWSMSTGEVVGRVYHRVGIILGALLTVDGSRAWVSETLRSGGWDFGISGSPPIELSGVLPVRPHLDFTGGVRKYKTGLPAIEDTTTGKKVFQLPAKLASPSDSQWDGQYLVAGYENGEVLILDFSNMLLQ